MELLVNMQTLRSSAVGTGGAVGAVVTTGAIVVAGCDPHPASTNVEIISTVITDHVIFDILSFILFSSDS